MKRKLTIIMTMLLCTMAMAQFQHSRVYTTLDNMPLSKADTFDNGADGAGGFTHYGRFFNNNYDTAWASWSGWALSNRTDDTTAGFENQYSAKPGHGVSLTPNYLVAYGNGAYIKLDEATEISGAYFTNSTYAYEDMKNGSGFSRKFGGDTGNDPDYFKLIITGYKGTEEVSRVEFYLADFRSTNNAEDYIVNDWTFVDFDGEYYSNPEVDSLVFRYESSDVGEFGMNTPATFCMDDLNAVPSFNNGSDEWFQMRNLTMKDTFYNGADLAGGISYGYLFFPNSYNSDWDSWSGWSYSGMLDDTTAGFGNQYSCVNTSVDEFYVSSGQTVEIRSPYLDIYDFGKNPLFKTRAPGPWTMKIKVTNSTYAALDMEHGSGFSKKFGGASGDDPDYFLLKISYLNDKDSIVRLDSVYLADFRFTDNSQDYILKDWKEIKKYHDSYDNLFHKIVFSLESSDNGAYGMNTPATFCLSYDFDIASVREKKTEEAIHIYPNPVHSVLVVQAERNIESLTIFGIDGKQLTHKAAFFGSSAKVNTENLTPGVYFVRIKTANGIGTTKFIKQ